MKKALQMLAVASALTLLGIGCAKEVKEVQKEDIAPEVIAQIRSLGFSTDHVAKVQGGYLVEGDILLTPENLNHRPGSPNMTIAQEEQYRTYNLVTVSGTRTITVKLDLNTSSAHYTVFSAALDESIRRFNAESLTLRFARNDAATSPSITIVAYYENSNVLGSAGFPTNSGDPYHQVRMNTYHYSTTNSTTNRDYIATIMAHEKGHCIGFRHTDYMNRKFSCGFSFPNNEGSGSVGAVHIPGTPTKADKGSWMLACIGDQVNRPFNPNDKTALQYLY